MFTGLKQPHQFLCCDALLRVCHQIPMKSARVRVSVLDRYQREESDTEVLTTHQEIVLFFFKDFFARFAPPPPLFDEAGGGELSQ